MILLHPRPVQPLPKEDMDHVLFGVAGLWEALRGHRLFLTGGTGFFGMWLLESFAHANDHLSLEAEITVLTRHPDRFRAKAPHLCRRDINLLQGDMRDFCFPMEEYPFVIHAATDTRSRCDVSEAMETFDAIVDGTRRVLDFAAQSGVRRMLYTSSGAIYGTQPPDLTHVPEDFHGAPQTTNPATAYGQAKRVSEFLCSTHSNKFGYKMSIARCFAFVGPHLPLDGPYAIGNFINDALAGRPIHIAGDGTARRSYLYAADLAVWLWTILLAGTPGRPYNVGSPVEQNIFELAGEVAMALHGKLSAGETIKPQASIPSSRYIPDTNRAMQELGLEAKVPLRDAICRTARWYQTGIDPD